MYAVQRGNFSLTLESYAFLNQSDKTSLKMEFSIDRRFDKALIHDIFIFSKSKVDLIYLFNWSLKYHKKFYSFQIRNDGEKHHKY